ncbi:MAG TPA: TonB family protein [Thermoanaerobaculia bacterium]|nr:TonB family protein [Thermoanaerobaculia bacterium]
MFESSLIDLGDKTKRVQTRRCLSLPVAVGIHVVLAASVAFAAYWNIAAVTEPSVNVVFFAEPPAPAVPSAPAPGPKPAAAAPKPVPVRPEQPVQPHDIPDEVPVADPNPTPVPVVTFAGPVDDQSSDSSGGGGGSAMSSGGGGTDGGVCVGPECGDDPSSLVPAGAPVTSSAPLAVGGAVTKPEAVYRVQPVYTEGARRIRLAGAVIVQAVIDEQGRVTDVELVKGLPMGLDRAALDAVRQWRFKPATLHGRPVKVFFNLTVRFEVR